MPQNGQIINNLPTNYLSVFDHFVRLMLKDLANNKMVNEKVKQKFAENKLISKMIIINTLQTPQQMYMENMK